jgi:penicillin-binding protein 1A
VVELAKEMGISAPLDPYASLVLGTGEVSVLDMAAAYNTLANGGVRVGPYVVDRVTDSSGRVLWQAPTTRTQVLPPDVAAATNWVLNQVVEGGTGKGAKFGQPVAGKTGTTENYGNAWFAGFTCKLTTAVWVGYPDTVRDMTNVHGIKVAGGTFPTTIFNRFMSRAAAGMESCPFDKPQELSAALVGPVTGGTGVSPSGTGVRPPGTGVTTGTGGDGGDGGEGGGTTVPPTSPSTSAPPPSSTPSTTVAPPPSSVPLAPPSGAATGPG